MTTPGLGWLLVFLGAAVVLSFLFGYFGHRAPRPNRYRCLRCDHVFSESPDRAYPTHCPSCRSPDWARSLRAG